MTKLTTQEVDDMMRDARVKKLVKAALREWLDEQFGKFGRWSFYSLCAMGFAGIIYMFLMSHGWLHK